MPFGMQVYNIVRGLTLVLLAMTLCACAKKGAFWAEDAENIIAGNAGDASVALSATGEGRIEGHGCWQPLADRLAQDGLHGSKVDALLATLGDRPTQSPMGRKIRELYKRQILQQKKPVKPQKHYKGVVTQDNARICQEYIARHEAIFLRARQQYGVPPHVAVALLFVETRLGNVLGDVPENAFYTLASMAISRDEQSISSWLGKLPGYEQHLDWLHATMNKRADWAYGEVRALVRYMLRDGIEPQAIPGSIYGAVGLCQFMPSNISTFGIDGDGDGRVDLFTVPDAVMSLSNYLYRHGWRSGMNYKQQHKILMTYNHSTTYANTILDLGQLVAKRNMAKNSQAGATKRNEKK